MQQTSNLGILEKMHDLPVLLNGDVMHDGFAKGRHLDQEILVQLDVWKLGS